MTAFATLAPSLYPHSHPSRNGPQIMALFVLPILSMTEKFALVDLVVVPVNDNDMQIIQFVVE